MNPKEELEKPNVRKTFLKNNSRSETRPLWKRIWKLTSLVKLIAKTNRSFVNRESRTSKICGVANKKPWKIFAKNIQKVWLKKSDSPTIESKRPLRIPT